eukprot:scaffold10199_cov146-Cylindrotheca_fusiformis.AAC.31
MGAPYDYAGEDFLSVSLPNYEWERTMLLLKLLLAFVAWIVVFPVLLASPSATTTMTETTSPNPSGNTNASSSPPKKGKQKGKSNNKLPRKNNTLNQETKNDEKTVTTTTEVSELANALCILGFLLTCAYMIVIGSPDNRYTTRGVFEAPLFTRDECHFLVDMAETVANRNFQQAQEERNNTSNSKNGDDHQTRLMLLDPIGWQKKRHKVYSTTDLNVVTDPFSKEDRQWIQQKLNARLAPTIQRLYGVPQGAIRASDVFFIRYDGDRQAALEPHTDDADVTFSVLLSEGFTGGGTKYYDRRNLYYSPNASPEVFAHVLPEIGQMTLFRSSTLHEGVQVEEGRRYLMIGFLSVDNVDPWTKQATGLSPFASWWSLNWAGVRFRAGYGAAKYNYAWESTNDWLSHSSYVRGLFLQLHELCTKLADFTSHHFFQQIIPDKKTNEFLQAMDAAYKEEEEQTKSRPSWFHGQQIDLNIGGLMNHEWSTRTSNADKFEQEAI